MPTPAGQNGSFADHGWLDAPLAFPAPAGAARYVDFSPLGMGGKAEVYLCRDQTLGRQVAYKVLRHDLKGNEDEERRLVREARVMARLKHASIPEVYEIGRDVHQRPFFTMHAAPGVTLAELLIDLRRGGRQAQHEFFLERRVHVIEQMARALGYAHACGVVHGDLKPENVIVEGFDAPMLIDWGLLELTDEAAPRTPQTHRHGTPLNMPPEQILGEGNTGDQRSDVYRLGTVLYECLALEPHAWGETIQDLLRSIVKSDVRPPRDVNPAAGVTPDLEAACMRALAKDPTDRFANAAEFADALRECQLDLLVNFERDFDVAPAAWTS
ncbi:MAG: serine/threonine protein kinase, partial [Planctomycetales bacterium]|nr:serine/threonine protein kinase [Planctomycetales bacterium]